MARYTRVAAALHWLMALLILANIIIGLSDGAIGSIPLHKSIGLTVLLLAIVRLGWRLGHPPPPLPDSIPPWQRHAAEAMHRLFYALMILIPLSGWLFVSNAPKLRPLDWFGLFPVPYLTAGPAIYDPAKLVHVVLGIGFAVLLVGHVGAALWHQWVHRIPILSRMAVSR